MIGGRPVNCPSCGSLLRDEFTWESETTLSVLVMCNDCGWGDNLVMKPTLETDHAES